MRQQSISWKKHVSKKIVPGFLPPCTFVCTVLCTLPNLTKGARANNRLNFLPSAFCAYARATAFLFFSLSYLDLINYHWQILTKFDTVYRQDLFINHNYFLSHFFFRASRMRAAPLFKKITTCRYLNISWKTHSYSTKNKSRLNCIFWRKITKLKNIYVFV